MVKPIMRDVNFLAEKSESADKSDMQTVQDLSDTLAAHGDECVGMAANMIGVKKRIIAVDAGLRQIIMINPVITKKSGMYETEESCLSLEGQRKTLRWHEIEVSYLDVAFNKQKGKFTDWTAQIIQHEIDHCNGVII